MTAGAVASVVATTEECERAQLLLSRVQDGEPVDEADRVWLKKHLDECDSCKTANRMLLEVGASYRLWLPVGLLASMRTETLTRAGELVGADWSHVPTPGKSAASASGGTTGAAGTGVAAGAVAAVAAAAIAVAGVGGLALLRNDDGAPADPAAKQAAASVGGVHPEAPRRPRKREAKPESAGGKFVAARAASSFAAAPALAAAPIVIPISLNDTGTPEAPNTPPESDSPQDRSEQVDDPPTSHPETHPNPTCRRHPSRRSSRRWCRSRSSRRRRHP